MKVTHLLKIHPAPFRDIVSGAKRAEYHNIRAHNIRAGDIVVLREYVDGDYTGRNLAVRVTHRQEGYGIPVGYAVLSIEAVGV